MSEPVFHNLDNVIEECKTILDKRSDFFNLKSIYQQVEKTPCELCKNFTGGTNYYK